MTAEKGFSFKDLFSLLPLFFALFMVGVILFPFLLLILTIAQMGIPREVTVIMTSLLVLVMAGLAVHGCFKAPFVRGRRGKWLLLVLLVPIIGPCIFFVRQYRFSREINLEPLPREPGI